jgi:hypothetical protein
MSLKLKSTDDGRVDHYVTLTWDNWPEGGSYGCVVSAKDRDEAELMAKMEMAESRYDEGAPEAHDTVETVYAELADKWHVVDCYPVKDFIGNHMPTNPTNHVAVAAHVVAHFIDNNMTDINAILAQITHRQNMDTPMRHMLSEWVLAAGVVAGYATFNENDIDWVETDRDGNTKLVMKDGSSRLPPPGWSNDISAPKVGDTIRHIKRGSLYTVIDVTLSSPHPFRCGQSTKDNQVLGTVALSLNTHSDVMVQMSQVDPLTYRGAWLCYENVTGMKFLRPVVEFTSDRFEKAGQ